MLKDSAHIQEMEAEWKNRKARRAGRPEVPPLYEMNDAIGVLGHFLPCAYDEVVRLNDNISVRFTDIGHLLGSASIEVWMTEGDVQKTIVFSGDIGNKNKPLIRDPQYTKEADYVVMECTYGDREHRMLDGTLTTPAEMVHVEQLADIIQRTLDRGGNVVIPAFAVGRTQELLYFIRKIKADKMVTGHDGFEVYLDSPLAVEATNVFKENMFECFDEETGELLKQGINPISFPGLKLSITSEESKNINFDSRPKVIISASGMCDAGRIRHHLKHNLWRKECSVVFAGYQAIGTLGRALVEGEKTVRLFGETIEVEAKIEQMEGISGHADRTGLLQWINAFQEKPKYVFPVHGDDQVCDSFAEQLRAQGFEAKAPFSGAVYDLEKAQWIKETEGIPFKKEAVEAKRATGVFERLVAAGDRLRQVIFRNEGSANKDLAKFADQIHSLCDKWDR
ncbi:MAG: MBL fold metallo-hydrolase RNA specificity domain-containing protein, partial [Lachnospiraceae bacterium]